MEPVEMTEKEMQRVKMPTFKQIPLKKTFFYL